MRSMHAWCGVWTANGWMRASIEIYTSIHKICGVYFTNVRTSCPATCIYYVYLYRHIIPSTFIRNCTHACAIYTSPSSTWSALDLLLPFICRACPQYNNAQASHISGSTTLFPFPRKLKGLILIALELGLP